MNTSIIDKQFEAGSALVKYLTDKKELSFTSEAENNFRKNLLLSAASYFEKEVCEILIQFAKSRSSNCDLIVSFIKSKGISRQYHTLFEWEKTNANKFFSHFGDMFKKQMEKKIDEDLNLQKGVKAFLELGRERNRLVHQNFAEVALDKTAMEIYDLYKTSVSFIDCLRKELILAEENA